MSTSNRHSPDPAVFGEVKERRDRAERPARFSPQPRPFICRSCGVSVEGVHVPHGWYSLRRHNNNPTERPLRLGVYCSIACLAAQIPRLEGIEADISNRWESTPYRQR